MTLAGELVLSRNQLVQALSSGDKRLSEVAGQRINMITSELQEAIMRTRMQPIGNILNKFTRIVRDLSGQLEKSIELIIEGKEVEQALEKIGYSLKPLDIVLFYTGADKFFGKPEYFTHYPAIHTSTIDFLLDSGVKIFGVDTMGIDRPYKFMIKEFLETKDASKLYPAHFYGRKREFIHIERLANLGSLPDFGFKVHCLPVRIKNTFCKTFYIFRRNKNGIISSDKLPFFNSFRGCNNRDTSNLCLNSCPSYPEFFR